MNESTIIPSTKGFRFTIEQIIDMRDKDSADKIFVTCFASSETIVPRCSVA